MDNKLDIRLEELAKQLEGEICTELRPIRKYYQLMVLAWMNSGEARVSRYPVPDPKSALIIIDILCSEFQQSAYDKYMFSLQWKHDLADEWLDWDDEKGHTICDYEINDNFTLIAPE